MTGSRAEYGLLRTLLRALHARADVEPQLIVTGMHLLERFGHTIDQIRADFQLRNADGRSRKSRNPQSAIRNWQVVPMQNGRDGVLNEALGLARGVEGLARAFERLHADLVVVLGDRIEALAAALAATATRRFLAHIHGGDVAQGDVDDAVRHAITKLAHLHFVATADAARRVVRMGERPEHVFTVGAPGLDELIRARKSEPRSRNLRVLPVRARTKTGTRSAFRVRKALIVQHPRGLRARQEEKVMTNLLRAVADEGLTGTIIHPCSDPGYSGIVRAIRKFRSARGGSAKANWPLHRSLPREKYLRELIRAALLVGNSSSGIIEAPFAGTPAVNVGPRQAGRLRGGRTVIDCGETYEEIRRAIRRALRMQPRRGVRVSYGDGRAGGRIARKLATVPLTDRLRRKRIAH